MKSRLTKKRIILLATAVAYWLEQEENCDGNASGVKDMESAQRWCDEMLRKEDECP